MWQAGKLPVPATQLATGTIVVQVDTANAERSVIYARVSSADQRTDLTRQVARLSVYAAEAGLTVSEVVTEVGSGLNGRRRKLDRVLRDASITAIVVEHRDRLTRFGFEYLESALAAQGRRIVVADPDEVGDDVVRDLHEVIVSMCARLYGKRAAKHRAAKALAALQAAEEV